MTEDSVFELARKQIYWMIAGVLITITVIALVFLFSGYQRQLVEVPEELRAELISLRFVNTPECFTYQDPITGRAFPGVIDVNKFTQERLDRCYRTENERGFKDYNFALELEGYAPIVDGEKQLLRTNNFFNKVDFTLFKEVYVRTGDSLEPTRMVIYVQTRI
ncbi:MAG TPA: hypothetical protein VJA18_04025 [Candidatus Nanoarchaeia archaeon]|nr:hypothetical protein [Candidatus Nanoarchaeia archaeon]